MVTGIFNYLGLKGSPPSSPVKTVEKPNAVRALPASWYTSEEMYQLERRAIFGRRWLLITHSLRLANPDSWLPYDVANFDFVLYNDNGEIKGLRDARHIDERRDDHPLIHIHIDCNGFIWVNLDPNEVPEVAWDKDFKNADRQERYKGLDFDDYVFDHSWEMKGAYNWKILSDNYNECYHCATTHPDLNALTDLHAYYVEPKMGYIEHYVATRPEQEARGLRVHPTYFFPSTSMNVSKHFFMLQRFVPHGAVDSTMRYEVYRNKNSPDDDFRIVNEMYKRVMGEDKVLCEYAQKNVNAGIFVNGEMHPRMEKGPLYIQKLAREAVIEQHEREQAAKQQKNWAAARAQRSGSWMGYGFGQKLAQQTPQDVVAY